MAISNFTQTPSKSGFLSFFASVFHRLKHEKISCLLADLPPEKLLSINGFEVEIQVEHPCIDLCSNERGVVISVLVPSSCSAESGILFFPYGAENPYYPDPTRTRLICVFNRASSRLIQ